MRNHLTLLVVSLSLALAGSAQAGEMNRGALKAKVVELRTRHYEKSGDHHDLTLENGTHVMVRWLHTVGHEEWRVIGKRTGGTADLHYLNASERREIGKILTPHLGGVRLVIEKVDKSVIATALKDLAKTPNELAIERLKASSQPIYRPMRAAELPRDSMTSHRGLPDRDPIAFALRAQRRGAAAPPE